MGAVQGNRHCIHFVMMWRQVPNAFTFLDIQEFFSIFSISAISYYYSKLLEILIKNLYSKGDYKNIYNHHILKWMFTYIF
jgi:hypothetical protein